MNKKQYIFLLILTMIAMLGLCICVGIVLPSDTIVDHIVHIIISTCIGIFAGIVLFLVGKDFKNK